tara:strand:- start:6415 stop:7173 length:759 start_codon:yes stop_codon:yes gene_type:complete
MKYKYIKSSINDQILEVSINRPKQMNAINPQVSYELKDIFEQYKKSNKLQIAILTGEGGSAFSAGNDLKHTKSESDPIAPFGGITSDYICYKPIIAAIEGYALGGGLEIALSCDILIASENSTFGFPEPKVGLFAGAGGAAKLAKLISQKQALYLLLTSELISADVAKDIGLISKVVKSGEALKTARETAKNILENSYLAISATKQIILNEYKVDFDPKEIEKYSEVAKLRESDHFEIGKSAFANKQKPEWS